jgi:hypothetical protein
MAAQGAVEAAPVNAQAERRAPAEPRGDEKNAFMEGPSLEAGAVPRAMRLKAGLLARSLAEAVTREEHEFVLKALFSLDRMAWSVSDPVKCLRHVTQALGLDEAAQLPVVIREMLASTATRFAHAALFAHGEAPVLFLDDRTEMLENIERHWNAALSIESTKGVQRLIYELGVCWDMVRSLRVPSEPGGLDKSKLLRDTLNFLVSQGRDLAAGRNALEAVFREFQRRAENKMRLRDIDALNMIYSLTPGPFSLARGPSCTGAHLDAMLSYLESVHSWRNDRIFFAAALALCRFASDDPTLAHKALLSKHGCASMLGGDFSGRGSWRIRAGAVEALRVLLLERRDALPQDVVRDVEAKLEESRRREKNSIVKRLHNSIRWRHNKRLQIAELFRLWMRDFCVLDDKALMAAFAKVAPADISVLVEDSDSDDEVHEEQQKLPMRVLVVEQVSDVLGPDAVVASMIQRGLFVTAARLINSSSSKANKWSCCGRSMTCWQCTRCLLCFKI